MKDAYFRQFEHRSPPVFSPMQPALESRWHFLAGMTVAAGVWYLQWRWSSSLNPENLGFSVAVAAAETLFFLGTLLFFYDIWREGDTPSSAAPRTREEAALDSGSGFISVDVFFTTYDEAPDIVEPSVEAALSLSIPENVRVRIYVLDDGNRSEMRDLSERLGVTYFSRKDNVGFKAGNLKNALFQTKGDFVVICDADTRMFPSFLENTLGYFRDRKVAWVQTPHWFYDIPEGETWDRWFDRHEMSFLRGMSSALRIATGKRRVGTDPFLSDPSLFFDVIQRRRNRHGASFCCGAGSIHRREAVFEQALKTKSQKIRGLARRFGKRMQRPLALCTPLEPFRFHVSEDIYTSILLHSDRDAEWTSVYHPVVEARMLSPWSMKAWATQRLKYAGGTFDIMLRDNPLFRRGMPWRIKLHYAATFFSYLNVLWAPVLLFAPAISLVFGISPLNAYSLEFFVHFLPAIVLSEISILAATKGHDVSQGRVAATVTLPINLRALALAVAGRRPHFPTTPKTPDALDVWRYVRVNILMFLILMGAGVFGILQTVKGVDGHSISLLCVNLFWLAWNMFLIGRILLAAFWRPDPYLALPRKKVLEVTDEFSTSQI